MSITKIAFITAGFILLGLGIVGIALPILPTTPFLLAASFCFMKGSDRLYKWIMANRHFGPRIERIRKSGLTKREKITIYLTVCALILPIIILTHSLHLRIFLIVLLVVKGIVFLRIKTAPVPAKQPPQAPENQVVIEEAAHSAATQVEASGV